MTQWFHFWNLPEETQNTNLKEDKRPMFIAVLFTITKLRKKPECPSVGEWIKQLRDNYTMEYYSTIKKKKILLFATAWMNLENTMLSETSQSEKGKYCMFLRVWEI